MIIHQKHELSKPLYNFSLALFLITVAASYLLAEIANEKGGQSAALGLFTVFQFALLSGVMALAWWLMPDIKTKQANSSLKLMLIVAVIARVILIGVDPYTSNDVDRYLFDGKIALVGLDPYSIRHDDISLVALREQWQPPAEHAAYTTLYPPLALAFFSLSATAGAEHAQLAWKTLLLISSLATLFLSVAILKKAKKLRHLALVALSPLLIIETGVGLHLDALSTLTVCLAIYFWQRHKTTLTGGMLGLGVLIKLLPAMLLMPLFLLHKKRKWPLNMVGAFLLTVISGYSVLFALGLKPIGSIEVFFQKWRFASPVYYFLEDTLPASMLTTLVAIIAICSLSAIALYCYFASKYSRQGTGEFSAQHLDKSHVFYMQASMAVPLMLSPVIFPWYVMPLVPLLALQPNVYLFLWITILPVTYEVIGLFNCCSVWSPAAWPIYLLTLVYLAFIFSLAVQVVKLFLPALKFKTDSASKRFSSPATHKIEDNR